MNYRKLLLYFALVIITKDLGAQTVTANISGKITNGSAPLETVTVGLYNSKDSLLIKTSLTGTDGNFSFSKLKSGSYYIVCSLSGFNKYITNELIVNTEHPVLTVDPIVLTPMEGALQNVTVTAQKPMIERKVDRTVVNVDAMISASGSTALDVLEKSPGVSVDQNGVISLNGRTGVVIFIDDKPTYLSGANLESYLRSLPSSTIEQIEIMTNPPAKYDAAGSAGVINIRLKRSRVKGFNGSVNLAYTQGRYAKTNNSFNFNYRYNKWNSFGTFSYNLGNNFSNLDINRHFINPDGSRRYDFLQHTYIRPIASAISGKIGADYYATAKTTFGIVLTGITRTGERDNDNESRILNAAYQLDSTIIAKNTQDNIFRNGGINLNYRHQYKKNGPELTADLDYIIYKTDNDQVFNNYTYLPDGTLTREDRLTGSLPAKINILSGKIDYSHPFKNRWKAETGVKSSQTKTDNIADYFITVNNNTNPDYDKTNHFIYKENIHAGYINTSREGKRISVQFGLRAEYTVSDGRQLGNLVKPDSSFRRTYSSLFPTAYMTYKLDSAGSHVLTLDYGKRINRPFYQDLNPFISPLDKFTYYVGNPFLQPAYTHNIQLSYGYKNIFSLTVRYSSTKNNTNETIEIINGTYYSRPGNIGKITNKSIWINVNKSLTKWLTLNLYSEVTNIHSVSNFYTGLLDTQGTYWYIQPNLQFKFGKTWNAQIDGYYRTNLISNQFELIKRGAVNAGVSKKLSAATTVRLTMNDMFYNNLNRGIINNLANTLANWRNAYDTRVITISLSVRFGKTISDIRRHNATGAQSEQNRVRE